MRDVYRGSACNIVVSMDRIGPQQSLLERRRNVADITPLRFIDLESAADCRCFPSYYWSEGIQNNPVNKRAWVLQERLLASRVVYFGGKEVFWECAHAIACETKPGGLPPHKCGVDLKMWRAKTEALQKVNGVQKTKQAYKPWREITQAYSECDLTKENDRLVALSGLAKEMGKLLGDEYLAGLWKGNLLGDLLWSVNDEHKDRYRPRKYRAPSWSWVSMEGIVTWLRATIEDELAEVREVFTKPLADDRTGEIISGHIKLCGILRSVTVTPDEGESEYKIRNCGIRCNFDTLEDSKLDGIDCIVLGSDQIRIWGLLLNGTGKDNRIYQRVGIFSAAMHRSDVLMDILDLPQALFGQPGSSNLWDRYKRGELGNDYSRIKNEIVARALSYLKPFMETITII